MVAFSILSFWILQFRLRHCSSNFIADTGGHVSSRPESERVCRGGERQSCPRGAPFAPGVVPSETPPPARAVGVEQHITQTGLCVCRTSSLPFRRLGTHSLTDNFSPPSSASLSHCRTTVCERNRPNNLPAYLLRRSRSSPGQWVDRQTQRYVKEGVPERRKGGGLQSEMPIRPPKRESCNVRDGMLIRYLLARARQNPCSDHLWKFLRYLERI